MPPDSTVTLEFDPALNKLKKSKKLTDGLSVVLQIRGTLWVANDESQSLERLTLEKPGVSGNARAGRHKQFRLEDYLDLPEPGDGEVDLEGLAYAGGYLWLVGSHSLKRRNPKPEDGPGKIAEKLAELEGDGNRFLLARIPVEDGDEPPGLKAKVSERRAARLAGDHQGNVLTRALKEDPHLGPYIPKPPKDGNGEWRGIPGKDNGLDIEGLAAAGKRLFIGLRGPVLRGWAVILEVEPEEDEDDDGSLKLRPIGANKELYIKHFLQLEGLGIRDLCVQGDDLLILAGPTLDLDGPVRIYRWQGAATLSGGQAVRTGELVLALEVPFGKGEDHAEGLSPLTLEGQAGRWVVVHDAAAKNENRRPRENELRADVYLLQNPTSV